MSSSKVLLATALLGLAQGSPLKPGPPPFHDEWTSFSKRQTAEVCSTDECKKFADSVLESRAKNYTDVDPCTDFATYTCGNWYDTHDYRSDQSSVGTLSVMADVNNAIMRSILESPYPANTSSHTGENATLDRANFDKLIAGYDACMDTAAIDKAGAEPLQKLIGEFDSSCGGDLKQKEALTDALIWIAKYGGNAILQAQPWPDDKTPDITTIALGTPQFGLGSKTYYNNSAALANYTRAIVGMFDNLLGEDKHDDHTALAKNVIDFEAALINETPNPALLGDVAYYYNPMNIAEAEKLLPEISFERLLKGLVPKNYTVENVIVLTPEYFPAISPVIQNATAETLDAYFKWVLIQPWAARLSDSVSAPYRRLQNELTGRDADAVAERWRICLQDVDTYLPWIESAFFVEKAFSPEAKTFGERIITDVEDVFVEKLKDYEWMSPEVKEKATQKVLNMVEKIGYPDISPNVLDPSALATLYAPLTVTNTSHFDNGLEYAEFIFNNTWNDVLHPTDKDRWYMTAPTVNAYFNPPTNEIAFPAGIMQQPLFNLDLPEYVSYGAFGAVAGHELTHAFDDGGSHYDENGAYNEWWDNSTLANFQNKTKCFENQYSEYYVITPEGEKLNVDGELTLGENIADGGGLSASFAAWQKRNAEKANEGLPGLEEYTPEQLFYLSFGGVWCGKRRPAEAVRRIYADPHSPPDVRILGTLANQRGFKEAFKCASKEPVCELW